jgi:hypothetical protein
MSIYAKKGDYFDDVTIPPESIKAYKRGSKAARDAGAGLSSFWEDCPMTAIRNDPGMGYYIEDDFVDLGLGGTITTIISNAGTGKYLVFGSAGATITPDAALGGGIVLTEATDNEAVSITTKQTPFQITSGAGSLWFEARIKTSTITTAKQAWFCGLMDATPQTATVPLTATGTIADINCVGFHHPEANTSAFDASYKANTVTAVEVNSDIGTLVAGSYVKLGMKFDTSNNVLSFYVDGALQAAGKTIPNATGTDFPADVLLAPVLAQLLAATASYTLTMDWWKIFQLR